MNEDILTKIVAFNPDYFQIGEALEVKELNKKYHALIESVDSDRISLIMIEWETPTNGVCGYKTKSKYIDVGRVESGECIISKL